MASALEAVEFKAGQAIFRQGDQGERFYIIQEGGVTVSTTKGGECTVLAKLGEGTFFGERALIRDDVRQEPSSHCSPHLAFQWFQSQQARLWAVFHAPAACDSRHIQVATVRLCKQPWLYQPHGRCGGKAQHQGRACMHGNPASVCHC